MRADRDRWEHRYGSRGRHAADPPSQFLQTFRHLIAPGPVLDAAAGDGRNSLYLARHGHPVDAIDISFTGLQYLTAVARAEHLPVRALQADLEEFPLPRDHYAAAVNIRYLQRTLFDALKRAVRPGGIVICETFLIEQRLIGHPTNPEHLLRHGELLSYFEDFEVLAAQEGRLETEVGPTYLGRLVARRPGARQICG
ncbi:MAG: class I SAM-dependent methyltransferase [Deltaproteobacteria bacterium]|nr:class I SAM-dependent methyltransferase [Deltaproteobacteria bacterium]